MSKREIKFRAWNEEDKEMIFLINSGLQYYDFEGNYIGNTYENSELLEASR